MEKLEYKTPTPIQAACIPMLLQKKDLMGLAQTGTGKTAAFALPLIQHFSEHPAKPRPRKVRALILSPTRELASQIHDNITAYAKGQNLSTAVIFGGVGYAPQFRKLAAGLDILVATPGRLIDHLERQTVNLDQVETLILDEADHMLDMGFAPALKKIVAKIPRQRHTQMFSATMPTKIQQLAKTILHDPVEVKLAVSKPAEKIIQAAYICYEAQKLGIIQSLFQSQQPERVIIFASSKLKVKEVTKALKRMKLNVGEMHSDLEQSQREEIMHEFRNRRIDILVATDIVARGIDIDDIRLVINYDVPHDSEDYVHRIGRTARANNDGCAITFVSETEQTRFKQIETFLGKDIYKLPVPEELGEGLVYAPRTSRKEGGKQVKNFSRNKKGGWKKKGGNHAKKQGERTVKN